MKKLIKDLKYYGIIGFYCVYVLTLISKIKKGYYKSDSYFLKKRFLKAHGYPLDLNNPRSLNEKLQTLKSVYRTKLHSQVSDKYKVREFFNIPYHIDKVNSARSKIIPLGSDIKDMGIGNFVERYCKKWKVNETKARSRK